MKQDSTTLFWIAEINLVLWLATTGAILFGDWTAQDNAIAVKFITITGCIFAAFLQHIAYHKIYKPIRKQEKKRNNRLNPTQGS